MKFSYDKKSSMFIYPNDTTKGTHDKMEIALKKELEVTKSALKVQTMRCRHLVVAFTRKLHEKELELRESKNLRDQQLSLLLRALLILESRLKKEQKLIRCQLEEKDSIIEQQEKEILKYKKLEVSNKWPGTNTEIKSSKQEESQPSPTTGEERLDNLCKGLLNQPALYFKDAESKTNDLNSEFDFSAKGEENTFKDNPVLESVNQILLRDEEELLNTPKPLSINLSDKVLDTNREDISEWYETNSNIVPGEQIITSSWCLNVDGDEREIGKKEMRPVDKSSPIKFQHLEEKACLEMSKKNLTVVDLEEIDSKRLKGDRAVSPVKSTASYEEIIPVSKNSNFKPLQTSQKPPALPPKPARLLKPHQVLQKKNSEHLHKHPPPINHLPPSPLTTQPNSESQTNGPKNHLPPVSPLDSAHSVNAKKPVSGQVSQTSGNVRHSHSETKPVKLVNVGKVNSKLKKNQTNTFLPNSLDVKNAITTFGKQKKTDDIIGNCRAIKIGSSVSSLITGLSRDTIVTELNGETNNNVTEDSHVSQLVRQFEVLGKFNVNKTESEANDIRKNFEEFKLEESYAESEESDRHDGDGAENKNTVNYYATLTIVPPPVPKDPPPGSELDYKMYETFLENTGLSQKSILTPSRMLSNHRSCLKPKDVKHRNRVKAAAAIEKCNMNASNGGSTVKYWTEPFL